MTNPTHLKLNNVPYPINADFRTWIAFERLLSDERATPTAKTNFIFTAIFGLIPINELEALQMCIKFYSCNHERKNIKNSDNDKEIMYDYNIDRQRISAAFLSEYGFNPWERDYLHWWEFKAMFEGLLGLTFKRVCEVRTMDLTDLKGEQLMNAKESQDNYRIWTKEKVREVEARKEADSELKKAWKSGETRAAYLRKLNEKK